MGFVSPFRSAALALRAAASFLVINRSSTPVPFCRDTSSGSTGADNVTTDDFSEITRRESWPGHSPGQDTPSGKRESGKGQRDSGTAGKQKKGKRESGTAGPRGHAATRRCQRHERTDLFMVVNDLKSCSVFDGPQ